MSAPPLSSLQPDAIHEIALQAKCDLRHSERTLAACLLEIDRRDLYFEWGVSCTLDYAELILGFDRHTAREMMRMCRAVADLSQLAKAYYRGTISASKMREITRVAVPETEAFWLEMATSHNTRQIEKMVARTVKGRKPNDPGSANDRPRPVKTRVTLDLEPEQMATLMDAVALVCKIAGERVGLNEAVELIAQDFLSTAHREEDIGNRYRLIIHCEANSKLAWVNTPKGPLRVSDETVEQALCDAEVIDLRKVSGEQPDLCDDGVAEQDVARPTWDGSDADERPSGAEDDAERPTWDGSNADESPSGTEDEPELPTDGSDASASPSGTEDDPERPTWDVPEEESHAWRLVDEIAAGIRTRDRAASLSRTVPPSVMRHVMARDQFRCAVPGCSMGIWKEVHHIQWRQDGGGHDIENLTLACSRHHKMLHSGLLTVSGTPSTGLVWRDRAGRILPGGNDG